MIRKQCVQMNQPFGFRVQTSHLFRVPHSIQAIYLVVECELAVHWWKLCFVSPPSEDADILSDEPMLVATPCQSNQVKQLSTHWLLAK